MAALMVKLAAASNSTSVCAVLAGHYNQSVLFSNSQNYTIQATDYWDVRSDLLPQCIFLPTTAEQVSHAVSLLNHHDTQFAVRSGGHMNVSCGA